MHPRLWVPAALLVLTGCPAEHDYPFCSLIDKPPVPEVIIDEVGISFTWEGAVHGLDVRELRGGYLWSDWCEDGSDAPCLEGPRPLPKRIANDLTQGSPYEVAIYIYCTAGGNSTGQQQARTEFDAP